MSDDDDDGLPSNLLDELTGPAPAASEKAVAAVAKTPAKPRAAAKAEARAKPEPVTEAVTTANPATVARVRIMLEENDNIPPTGLFIGVNGRGYLLKPGVEADVPVGVLDVLKNAIVSMPQIDPDTRQVIGYRDRMKYPFRML